MQRLIVPVLVILISATAMLASAESEPAGVVNINSATADQLQLLPRVGPKLAQRILDFREENGEFQKVDELIAVKGIGETSFEKLRPYVSTSGKTTLTEKVRSPRSTSESSDDRS
jgi:competence protein ComEA